MSETLIPTMQFRRLVPSAVATAIQPAVRRLQQRYETPGGQIRWIDVPVVEETPNAPTP